MDSGPAVPLAKSERRSSRKRTALQPKVIHEAIRKEGEEELTRPSSALLWSGLAAGLSMGFSLVGEGVLAAGLPETPWRTLVAKLGYSLGFLFVILGRQQLFTEHTLVAVLPFLARPGLRMLVSVARVWALVLLANVAGAALFAWSLTLDGIFDAPQREAFAAVGRKALEPGFLGVLGRGVYGGWLIALMVWLLPAAQSARFFIIVAVTWLVGAGHFNHAVAGSVDVLHLVATGEASVRTYLFSFLLPVFLGNSLGGVALVAALNHAQVVAGTPGNGANGRASGAGPH